MISLSSRLAAAAVASLLLVGSAYAQTPAPATAPAAAPAAKSDAKAAPADKKARSEASLACSKDADTKSLHGKPRKKFMSDCKKEAKAKAS
jgi:hypothetical protein